MVRNLKIYEFFEWIFEWIFFIWGSLLTPKRNRYNSELLRIFHYHVSHFSKIKQFTDIKYLISIFSWWPIEHGLEPSMSSLISNVCLKYAPKWMVSSLFSQTFSGDGLALPRFFLGSGFALNSQALYCAFDSGFTLDSRALIRSLDSGFALHFGLEN